MFFIIQACYAFLKLFAEHQSQLNEQCNPNADYPCTDNYAAECKRYGTTEEYRCQCKNDYEMDENNWCRKSKYQ